MDWFIWMNRVGIILNFISFWFAAPEILGEERLRKIEASFEKVVKAGSTCLVVFLFVTLIPLFVIMLFFLMPALITGIMMLFTGSSLWAGIKTLLAVIGFWLGVALLVQVVNLVPELTERFLNMLADNQRIRQRALILGALLFVLGNILQFVATYAPPLKP